MLEEVYGDHALSKSQCYRWFKKFQSGDFELDNEPHGKPPQKFEDAELQALLDEDSTQMQEKLAKQLQVSQDEWALPEYFPGEFQPRFVRTSNQLNKFGFKNIEQKKGIMIFATWGGERLTLQVEQTIRTLSKEGNSYSVIVKKLKAEGLDVGKATICRVVNGIGKKREAEYNGQKFQVDRPRPVRTGTVSKVKRLATTENPPSQRQLSRMCGTSLKTINNIIHKDLELDTRRKGKVHKLTPFHMKNRATNARKLYEEHLAGSRSEYTAKLDEAWMYVTYCNGIRKICYIKRGNQVPDNWVHQCSETFPKGFMVVGVMTGRGVLPLIKVPSKVKVNSEFYIECVLKPVIEQLKDLYPGEMDKVFLHHDKASSHTSNKTQQFLQEMKDTLGKILSGTRTFQ
ncbi:hypothetical protein LAZ67_22001403 [Cordylochernes scorpioides]|uniref:Mos1 transposase HTH domain-containing protein n=1 Tax=Cordylochernes scorpioides TaxID=51811 RepID=A0ABY6LP14_9ARAC|nr:hypothetical protein LAZ67_22001403 [Cordylochernes scorpioides]